MAIQRQVNRSAKSVANSGLGTDSSGVGGRFFNKNGNANVRQRGYRFFEHISWYHTMLSLPGWKFLSIIFCTYLLINLVFAILYLSIGLEHISGMVANSPLEKFAEAYFFSAQTFTTVGYGRLSPTGFLMSFTASFEALIGLLSFALATGLFYGRFSRPRAFLAFSKVAIMAPFRDGVAFMFRMAPFKNNNLSDAEVKMTLALSVDDGGRQVNRFYPLVLDFDKVNVLSTNWTVVHPIDDKSPFFGLSNADLLAAKAEVLVFVKAFDDTFSNTVMARTSYLAHEMLFGARFLPMYEQSTTGSFTVVDLSKIDDTEPADIGFATARPATGPQAPTA
jgi:inward rectifier potassium channel